MFTKKKNNSIPSYADRANVYEPVVEYFRMHFTQVHRKNNEEGRVLYTHFTSVVDTKATQGIIRNGKVLLPCGLGYSFLISNWFLDMDNSSRFDIPRLSSGGFSRLSHPLTMQDDRLIPWGTRRCNMSTAPSAPAIFKSQRSGSCFVFPVKRYLVQFPPRSNSRRIHERNTPPRPPLLFSRSSLSPYCRYVHMLPNICQ